VPVALGYATWGTDSMTETRNAQCACGGVSVTTKGEPDLVVVCNCIQCQRRTGSPFGVGAYFKRETVQLRGITKTFERKVGGSERAVVNHFCPDCGSTVFWTLDLRPQHIGIAVGHFADPGFMPNRVEGSARQVI
jgi:hypothetical protein